MERILSYSEFGVYDIKFNSYSECILHSKYQLIKYSEYFISNILSIFPKKNRYLLIWSLLDDTPFQYDVCINVI